MKKTTNYNLNKPDGNDLVDIEALNQNMDTLDTQVKALSDGKAAASHSHTKSQIADFPAPLAPTAHKSSHAKGGSDALTAADVGADPLAASGATSGSGSSYSLSASGFALLDGAKVKIKLHTDSADGATLNVNGTGAKRICYSDGKPIKAGHKSAVWLTAIYSSTLGSFILTGKGGDGGSSYAGTMAHSATFEALMGWSVAKIAFRALQNSGY